MSADPLQALAVLGATSGLGAWVAGAAVGKMPSRARSIRLMRRAAAGALVLSGSAVFGFLANDLLRASAGVDGAPLAHALGPVFLAIPGTVALLWVAVRALNDVLERDEHALQAANTLPTVAEIAQLQAVVDRELAGLAAEESEEPLEWGAPI